MTTDISKQPYDPFICPCIDCKTRRGEFDANRFKTADAPNSITGGQDFDIALAKGAAARKEAAALAERAALNTRSAPRSSYETDPFYDPRLTPAETAWVRDEGDKRPGGRTYDNRQEEGRGLAFNGSTDYVELDVGFNPAKNAAGVSPVLSTDPFLRKEVPIATGVIDYFPLALAAVAAVSLEGQKQHGTSGWDRSKSSDESDALMRHFVERGTRDVDGHRHSAKVAWRALALLQKELEADRERDVQDAAADKVVNGWPRYNKPGPHTR